MWCKLISLQNLSAEGGSAGANIFFALDYKQVTPMESTILIVLAP